MTTRNAAGIGRFIRWAFTGFNIKKYELIINSKKVYNKAIYNILLNIFDYFLGCSFIIFFLYLLYILFK